MPAQSLPYVIALGLMFGSTLLVSRFSVGQFAPTTYIWLRLAISSLAFAAVYAFSRQRDWPRDRFLLRHAIILGIFGTAIPMVGYVSSLVYLSAGVVSMFMTSTPAFTVIFAQFLLPDEQLTLRKGMGVTLALGGAALLALRGETGLSNAEPANPLGYALILGAIIIDSLMMIYARRHMRDMDTFSVSSVRILTATLVIAPLSLLLVGFDLSAVTTAGYVSLVWAAAAGTFGGLLLALWVTQNYGATATSMTSYIIPVVAAVGGVFFLDETITTTMIIGMGLIIVGIAFLNRRRTAAIDIPA